MAIPPLQRETSWSQLNAEAKRARLLAASREVFARNGLDAPMPAVAAAAGVGVGSVYRQFPSKRDLLAALVVERLEEVRRDADAALESRARPWAALTALLWEYAERQAGDDVVAEAMACVQIDPDVAPARAASNAALERLLDAARAEGRLRSDATTLDLRLIFAAARSAKKVEPEAWRRMLELGIDSLAR
ncbi:MAG TPA: TetR family transcriptional regulator [Solirubrobacterales bacterium]|nr:TetR family transcriptional regulator [Solirubrobacterales bacterium]